MLVVYCKFFIFSRLSHANVGELYLLSLFLLENPIFVGFFIVYSCRFFLSFQSCYEPTLSNIRTEWFLSPNLLETKKKYSKAKNNKIWEQWWGWRWVNVYFSCHVTYCCCLIHAWDGSSLIYFLYGCFFFCSSHNLS